MPLKWETVNRFQLLEVVDPTGLEDNAMIQPDTEPSTSLFYKNYELSSMGLSDLPRELRDMMYTFALVPAEPIEFAPLKFDDRPLRERRFDAQWQNDINGMEYFAPGPEYESRPWGGYSGELWHLTRHATQIQPSLQLLRASKQVYDEASPISYRQDFRYSLTAALDQYAFAAAGTIFSSPLDHIAAALISPVPASWKTSYAVKGLGWPQKYRSWLRKSDSTTIVLLLTKLRSLASIFFIADHEPLLKGITKHPVHSLDLSHFTNFKVFLDNLISCYGGRQLEVRSEEMYGPRQFKAPESPVIKWFPFSIGNMTTRSENSYLAYMKEFFDEIQGSGWVIKDVVYDNHYTYPASEKGYCTKKKICAYHKRIEEAKAKDWRDSVGRERYRARAKEIVLANGLFDEGRGCGTIVE